MAIRRSLAPQIAALIADLTGADAVRREAATARLAIAGPRAVDPLLQALAIAAPAGKAAILSTLEMIAEPRSLPASIAALPSTDMAVALAAIGAVRVHLKSTDSAVSGAALEALTQIALEGARPEAMRVAAIVALSDLGAEVLDAVRARLGRDRSPRVRRAAGLEGPAEADLELAAARLEAAVRTPTEDPDALRRLLLEAPDSVGLSTLHELVLAFHARERAAADAAARAGWAGARAAAHTVLARRGSRLALFDLRDALGELSSDTFDSLVDAAATIGDASCLEPLVTAWQRTTDRSLREAVAEASRAIVARERLTRRHAVIKRLLARAPDAASFLARTADA